MPVNTVRDRDTLYQAEIARNITWGDENKIPTEDYVAVTQGYAPIHYTDVFAFD